MSLLKVATSPAPSVGREATVFEAVRVMNENRVGALVVVHDGKLAGMFSERDVMTRVVAKRLDAKQTPVGEVMTRDVVIATDDMSPGAALRVLVEKHIRHLPVVDAERRVLGVVALRDLLRSRIAELSGQLDSVVSYFADDGIDG